MIEHEDMFSHIIYPFSARLGGCSLDINHLCCAQEDLSFRTSSGG